MKGKASRKHKTIEIKEDNRGNRDNVENYLTRILKIVRISPYADGNELLEDFALKDFIAHNDVLLTIKTERDYWPA